jgi:hypothetical protein
MAQPKKTVDASGRVVLILDGQAQNNDNQKTG